MFRWKRPRAFLKKSKNRGLKILTYSKTNRRADIFYLSQKKNKTGYAMNIKIKGITKINTIIILILLKL